MASPNKIKNVGYDYKPFQMKAAGPKYKNSPIEKNYGSPAQRGFDFTGGVGSKEMEGGVGSAFDYASPAKGFWDKVKSFGKKALDPLGLKKKLFGKKKDPAAAVEGAGGGDGSHTHGANGEAIAGGVAPLAPATPVGADAEAVVEDPATAPTAPVNSAAVVSGAAGIS